MTCSRHHAPVKDGQAIMDRVLRILTAARQSGFSRHLHAAYVASHQLMGAFQLRQAMDLAAHP